MSELKNISVEEVSLVDAGANPDAGILLTKKKDAADTSALEKKLAEVSARLAEHIQKVEDAELRKVAAKYEILGEKPEELAQVLKQAKGTPVYDKLICLLDKELDLVKKSQMFEEIGKSGTATSEVSIEKIAAQIQKDNPALSRREAIERAFELHPEMEY